MLIKVRLSYCVCFSFVGGCGSFSLRETHGLILMCFSLYIFQARSAKVHVRNDGVLLFYIAESDGKVHVREDGVLLFYIAVGDGMVPGHPSNAKR